MGILWNSQTKENWNFIARTLGKETTECTFKFHSMIASQIQINEWTPEEDKLLFGIVRYLKFQPRVVLFAFALKLDFSKKLILIHPRATIFIAFTIIIFFPLNPRFSRSNQKKSNKIKWIEVAREFYQKSSSNVFRNEKTCREHWISHLDPTLNK